MGTFVSSLRTLASGSSRFEISGENGRESRCKWVVKLLHPFNSGPKLRNSSQHDRTSPMIRIRRCVLSRHAPKENFSLYCVALAVKLFSRPLFGDSVLAAYETRINPVPVVFARCFIHNTF
jgi:hypothetical protein